MELTVTMAVYHIDNLTNEKLYLWKWILEIKAYGSVV
jgi:hypothetical protein